MAAKAKYITTKRTRKTPEEKLVEQKALIVELKGEIKVLRLFEKKLVKITRIVIN